MTAVAAPDSSPTAAEYRAATAGAAIFHSPAGRLRLTGADARDLLNRLSTNSINPDGAPGAVSATVLTSDRGRIVDLVYVIHCGDHQLLLTGPGQQENVTAFLDKYTIMEDLEVADITDDTVLLTLTGPYAAAIAATADPAATDPATGNAATGNAAARVIALPGNPEPGADCPTTYQILAPAGAAAAIGKRLEQAGAVRISAAAAETLRIARHQPASGTELGDAYNPLEAGLIGAIDFHKGCYIGQEVIARLDTYQKVQKYLVALRFDPAGAAQADRAAATLPGARLVNDAGAAMGIVTSAAALPDATDAGLVGLGYVRTAAAQIGGRLQAVSDALPGIVTAQITARPLLFGGEKPAPPTR